MRRLSPVPTAGHLRAALLPVGLAAVTAASSARAQSVPGNGLRTDVRVDIPVTAGAAGAVIALEVLRGALAPRSCRVCGVDGLDREVRDAVRWNDTAAAGTISDWTGFLGAPLTAVGTTAIGAAADRRFRDTPSNVLVVTEATALAVALDDIVKLVAARQRPYAHFRDPDASAPADPDENLSFYSGHTNLAFATAVASGTVASMRGYRLAPLVWAASLPVAAFTGYLRIAADKHYFTDVLAGALIGGAAGFVVPFVFHRAPSATADPGAMPAAPSHGLFVSSSWSF